MIDRVIPRKKGKVSIKLTHGHAAVQQRGVGTVRGDIYPSDIHLCHLSHFLIGNVTNSGSLYVFPDVGKVFLRLAQQQHFEKFNWQGSTLIISTEFLQLIQNCHVSALLGPLSLFPQPSFCIFHVFVTFLPHRDMHYWDRCLILAVYFLEQNVPKKSDVETHSRGQFFTIIGAYKIKTSVVVIFSGLFQACCSGPLVVKTVML